MIIKDRSIGIVKTSNLHSFAREVNPLANEAILIRELDTEIKEVFGQSKEVVSITKDDTMPLGVKVWQVKVKVGPLAYQNWTYEEI